MALSEESLEGKIKSYIIAEYGRAPEDPEMLERFAKAMAKAVVEEITQNAVVQPGTFSNSGGGISGTGTIT